MFYKHKEGGFNKRLYRMIEALAKQGHEVHYLSCESFPIDCQGVYFHPISVPGWKKKNVIFWFLFFLIAPFEAYRVCKRVHVDRIAVFGAWYAAFMWVPRLVLGIRIILFLRADSTVLYQTENRSVLARWTNYVLDFLGLYLANEIWVNIGLIKSNIIKRYHISPNKIKLIYNNIDEFESILESKQSQKREEFGINKDEFTIATSGIFYKRKNIDILIRAFAKAFPSGGAQLILIGDDLDQGSERHNLEELALSLGINKSVLFTGWRKDSKDLISICDLYVLPTLHEGFPNSLLDALSVDCPCLGSRISELEEILYYDELLFSPEHPDELAKKMVEFASNAQYRVKVRNLSKERANIFLFDWDKAVVDAVSHPID